MGFLVQVSALDADRDRFLQWAAVFEAAGRARLGAEHDVFSVDELAAMESATARGRRRAAWVEELRVVGAVELVLPQHDNTDLAECYFAVLPGEQGTAVEEQLLDWAVGQAEAAGRTRMTTTTSWAEGAQDDQAEFFASAGFAPAQLTLRSDLMLPIDRQPEVAAGYALESAVDGLPEEWLADRAALSRRMSTEIPLGELAHEEERWDPERVRAEIAMTASMGRRSLETVARHLESGRLVGFTHVQVPAGTPHRAYQHDTLVDSAHRGHGLGIALKIANSLALQEILPAVRYVRTWNAVDNHPMLAVNRALGYVVTAHMCEWQRHLPPRREG